ncbi:MAG: metallophosphoesterase [Bdellovibrio sp.]|nr:metallophosphoesterase [Bdellovibrio sp.]
MKFAVHFFVCCFLLSLWGVTQAFEFKAGPYVQSVAANSASIRMEAEFAGTPKVVFFREGETETFSVNATLIERNYHADKKVGLFEAKLMGLVSGARYLYQIQQGSQKSGLFLFKTLFKEPHTFAFLALSDAQSGYKVTRQAVNQSLMKYAFASYVDERTFPVSFALFTGDLVQKGNEYKRWNEEFFAPMAPLMSRLCVYPAIGNHEENTPYYFSYFALPRNGSPESLGHWYYFDYQNVRFITLNSNPPYTNEIQLAWLDTLLLETEGRGDVDFVVLQLHHPAESELWPEGESPFSKTVNTKLAEFIGKSGKATIVLSGHTHGYSRGQDPNQPLFKLINGSIGGATDNWGEFKQKDYLNYVMSKDEYGWLFVQVTRGENAAMSFKRYSFGKDGNVKDQGVVDQFILRKNNATPDTPHLTITKVSKQIANIESSPFKEAQGDTHLTSEWQAGTTPAMDNIFWGRTTHAYNEYGGSFYDYKPLLTKLSIAEVTGSGELKTFYVRLRYRDSALAYSDWSTPIKVERP